LLEEFIINLEKFITLHSWWGPGISFLAGILASLSPCIYPLIPITLGVIGAYSVSSKRKGFVLSSIFVLGLALTYTSLGVISAALGIFLGKIMVNPFTYSLVGIFLLFLGLSLFDIVKIPFFSFNLNHKKRGSLFSIFIAGIISGLAIIPCIFPVLGAILGVISLKRDILYGGVNLFSFSLGYGVILLILGTFTSLISKLPKHGVWTIIIKKCIGIILLVTAFYFFIRALLF
jgi:thiol:disulfide interchange protein DsbD